VDSRGPRRRGRRACSRPAARPRCSTIRRSPRWPTSRRRGGRVGARRGRVADARPTPYVVSIRAVVRRCRRRSTASTSSGATSASRTARSARERDDPAGTRAAPDPSLRAARALRGPRRRRGLDGPRSAAPSTRDRAGRRPPTSRLVAGVRRGAARRDARRPAGAGDGRAVPRERCRRDARGDRGGARRRRRPTPASGSRRRAGGRPARQKGRDLWLERTTGVRASTTDAPGRVLDAAALLDRYATQLRLYALATERIVERDVASASLLLLDPGWATRGVPVEVPVDVSGAALAATRRLCRAYAIALLEERFPARWEDLLA
jgi:hypothetical protein